MAENEYLDSSKARRWLKVAEGLCAGTTVDELAELIQERFYKTLRVIARDIQLTELLTCINDVPKLTQLFESIEGASDVKFLLLEAARAKSNPMDVFEHFLASAMQNCLYDIPHLAAERGESLNLSDARRKLDEACRKLAPDRRRIAEKWVENPSWNPVKPRQVTTIQPAVDVTKNMLSESLIAGLRK